MRHRSDLEIFIHPEGSQGEMWIARILPRLRVGLGNSSQRSGQMPVGLPEALAPPNASGKEGVGRGARLRLCTCGSLSVMQVLHVERPLLGQVRKPGFAWQETPPPALVVYIRIRYTYVYIRTCMHACMHACMHTYRHTYTCTNTCTKNAVSLSLSLSVCMYILYIYIHAHIYMHIWYMCECKPLDYSPTVDEWGAPTSDQDAAILRPPCPCQWGCVIITRTGYGGLQSPNRASTTSKGAH